MRTHRYLRRAGLLGHLLLVCLALHAAYGGSATWSANPVNGDWNNAANWSPNTVPNGPNDIATFEASNKTDVTISTVTEVSELVFAPGGSGFTIQVAEDQSCTISGTGITNNSGVGQNFVMTKTSHLDLTNSATAGDLTLFTLLGATELFQGGGQIFFLDTSSAGHATFVVNSAANGVGNGPAIGFLDNATAANGTFTAQAGSQSNVASGIIFFSGAATGGDGNFTIEGAGTGASVAFFGSDAAKPTAGNGIFNIKGSSVSGGSGGFAQFSGGTAGSATFITSPGNGGGGGYITFLQNDESNARFELFGGSLNAEYAGGDATVTVGSIEGNAQIALSALGAHQRFITGSNDLSTIFSGTITDVGGVGSFGSLEKIGRGTLTLSGASTYHGPTTVHQGILFVTNLTGSATGTGTVLVTGGTLGGSGNIAGGVRVGTNTGVQAFLAPSKGAKKPATLTIRGALTLNDDSTYICHLNTKRPVSDEVIASGVVINSEAKFSFRPTENTALAVGQIFTVIGNTAAAPTVGAFHNLPEGKILIVNGSKLQASYSGGDGNDLTLNVVP
jgi:autotransporter-associated beta strand protein